MSDLFYVFGIALVVLALVVSFLGLRSERFPDSRALYTVGLGLMGGLVVASCAFAVVLAREEADHREQEQAQHAAEEEAAEEPAEDPGTAPAEEEEPVETEPAEAEVLELTSPEDGALVFDNDTLEAPAGEVEIEYTNPSSVPHNVAIEADGETVAQGETVTGGEAGPAQASLEPGTYTFFCAIPGHRGAGMEGELTISK